MHKFNIKNGFKFFLYTSFIFLIVALYKANYLVIPKIYSFTNLTFSFILLLVGFIFSTLGWTKLLNKANINITTKEGLASIGLTIFGKYIPGKIWMILGRASYIAKIKNESINKLSSISLKTQIITLWTGLIVGSIGLIFINKLQLWGWLILASWIVFTILIFTNLFELLIETGVKKILSKNIDMPKFSFQEILNTLPWFFFTQFFWSIGFFFLIKSIYPNPVEITTGFSFSLAATLGIIAIIAPGGLGIREGILFTYLSFYGIDTQWATTISITSRLWFLIGEIFIFITASILSKLNKSTKNQNSSPQTQSH